MPAVRVARKAFLEHPQGRTLTDVVNESKQPIDCVIEFFNSSDRQSCMEDSELHHDRSPLAGVLRDLESVPKLVVFWAWLNSSETAGFGQSSEPRCG